MMMIRIETIKISSYKFEFCKTNVNRNFKRVFFLLTNLLEKE